MQGFRAAHEINFNISALEQKQEQVRNRVRKAFYEDLFLMLASSDRRQITAREIEERHEEKLLALGPVLEQLNQDLLDPLIDNSFLFYKTEESFQNLPELEGQDLKIEYVSIMAQAQKLISIGSIERFTGYAGNLMQAAPEIRHRINAEKLIEVYADYTSIPPGIVRTEDEANELKQAEQDAMARQQQMQQMQQMTQSANQLAATKMDGDTALNRLIDQAEAGRLA